MLHSLKSAKPCPASGLQRRVRDFKRSIAKPRLSLKILPKILLITVAVSCQLLAVSSRAQVSSAAFDPNCYFPKIGTTGEIDTIYGAHHQLFLGEGMLNLGPTHDGTYGRLSCGLLDTPLYSVFKSWPSFNLHKLQILGELLLPKYYQIVRFGHFRSPKYRDILATASNRPALIFWQDDKGNYDSSRYTALWSSKRGTNFTFLDDMVPYSAHISSDTVEDIVGSAVLLDSGSSHGDSYLIYFKGGDQLKAQGKIANSDSMYSTDSASQFLHFAENPVAQGDFRGVGREDLLQSDQYGNIFYFKNDLPFSMKRFLDALRFDTLFAQWQNPNSQNSNLGGSISMQVFTKATEDSSQDLIKFFNTQYGSRSIQEYRIFKGGKNFGLRRWTADSAAFVIHEPYYYDGQFNLLTFGTGVHDCGHMTGTENRVLYIGGELDGGFYGYHFFYVLGDAIDDKADMVIGAIPNTGGADQQIDTIVADGDQYQDIIMGLSGFGLETGGELNGTIYVVHGSLRIPERTRSVLFENSNDPENISVFPNPVTSGSCTLDLSFIEQQDLHISIWDLLGREVYAEQIYASLMRAKYPITISSLSSGTYILEVKGKNFSKRLQIQVLK